MKMVDRLIKGYRNKGLIIKIVIFIAFILIMPSFLVCLFYYRSYYNTLTLDVDEKLKQQLIHIENKMNSFNNIIQNVTYELVNSQEFVYFLDKRNKLSEREKNIFLNQLGQEWISIQQNYPELFCDFKIYAENTTIIPTKPFNVLIQPIAQFPNYIYELGLEDNFCYGTPEKELDKVGYEEDNVLRPKDKDFLLPVYYYIRNIVTDHVVGIIELDIMSNKIMNGMHPLEEQLPYYELLLDRTGHIIYQQGNIQASQVKVNQSQQKDIQYVFLEQRKYRGLISSYEKNGLIGCVLIRQDFLAQKAFLFLIKLIIAVVIGEFIILCLVYCGLKKLLNRLLVLDDLVAEEQDEKIEIGEKGEKYCDEISRIQDKFNNMAGELQSVVKEAIVSKKAQKQAELYALQAQINPHFLANTLECIRMQCEVEQYDRVSQSIQALGDMFHYSSNWKEEKVELREEIKHLQHYLEIMKSKMLEDLVYEIQYSQDVLEIMIPKMILQPLVENSFTHGFKEVEPPWYVSITMEIHSHKLIISISNNGSYIPQDRLDYLNQCLRNRSPINNQSGRSSIGIMNVLQRLDMLINQECSIQIRNLEEQGVKVKLEIGLGG